MPFSKNDPNINRKGRLGPRTPEQITMRTLARAERANTAAALVRLRDNAADERVRLDASKLLASYADGVPRPAKEAEPEEPQVPISTGDLSEAELTAQLSAAPTQGEA